MIKAMPQYIHIPFAFLVIWDIIYLYPTKIVLSVDTFLTEIRLFQSLSHRLERLE